MMKEYNVDLNIKSLSDNARLRGKKFEDLIFNFFPVLNRNKDGSTFDGYLPNAMPNANKFIEIKSCEVEVNRRKRNGRVKFTKSQLEYLNKYPENVLLFLVLHKKGRVYKIYQISGDKIPIQKQVSWKRLVKN